MLPVSRLPRRAGTGTDGTELRDSLMILNPSALSWKARYLRDVFASCHS